MTPRGRGDAWVDDDRTPWWADDPELMEIRRRTAEEFERELEQHQPGPVARDVFEPVVADVLGGASWRELADARDDLARARARYEEAVRAARAAGLSWGEIGRVLGVPRQLLHRRFSRRYARPRGDSL
jgi:DNA-directed RNA polymerase specialized sigma24 family protein